MNNEQLEKMAWLYEQGFEPDMVYCKGTIVFDSLLWNHGRYLDDRRPDRSAYSPYFTESKLWSLLPNCIGEDETYHLAVNKIDDKIGYYLDYDFDCVLTYEERDGGQFELEEDCSNLHLALLDLLIWTIKEGHLKP